MTAPIREAGPALDAEVAEKVMGWPRMPRIGREEGDTRTAGYAICKNGVWALEMIAGELVWFAWRPSRDLLAAWQVAMEVQRRFPGWRFCLLGGDESYGYRRTGDDTYEALPDIRTVFGWRAEFFGHIDPTQNSGQRHGSESADTAPLAICLAALAALDGAT